MSASVPLKDAAVSAARAATPLVRKETLLVRKDHPALAGHFPGRPVVPGVVVLDLLVDAAERQLGQALRLTGLAHAKFPSPLLPDTEAHASFRVDGDRLAFEVEHDGRTIARGVFRLATGELSLDEPAAGETA